MNWKRNTIIFYALIGLAVGVISGIITVNNAVEKDKKVDLSLQSGAKIGIKALDAMSKTILK